jgi:hypothetical protein
MIGNLLKSWTSTSYFSNSTSSYVTTVAVGSPHLLLKTLNEKCLEIVTYLLFLNCQIHEDNAIGPWVPKFQ